VLLTLLTLMTLPALPMLPTLPTLPMLPTLPFDFRRIRTGRIPRTWLPLHNTAHVTL
jgi:hypothetical protein